MLNNTAVALALWAALSAMALVAPRSALAASSGAAHAVPVAASAPAASASAADSPAPEAAAPAAELPAAPTGVAQRVYEAARPKLLQVRTLLAGQDSQSSVGSGFLVSPEGHLVTNYHVVSQYALQPQRHRLVYASTDGQQGALQLLAFDVVHDLALLKVADPAPLGDRGMMSFRPAGEPVARGSRIFALGNPLDVGFAVTEGAYNGLVERSFVPTLFFGGSLSPGMSGGPTVDDRGRVLGVNVATRRDGEQVSFLVPAEFVMALLERSRKSPPITQAVYPQLAEQLLAHQAVLTDRFVADKWRGAGHPRYLIPVPQETFMRCWGQGSPQEARGLQFERSDCAMDSRVFVSGSLLTGHMSVRHETYDGHKLGALRFAERYTSSFRNEFFGADSAALTAPKCHEGTVDRQGLPLRSVMCMRAYKKLPGLYTMSLLVATLDQSAAGALGRFDASGVSFDNASRLAAHYLDGFAWTQPNPSNPPATDSTNPTRLPPGKSAPAASGSLNQVQTLAPPQRQPISAPPPASR
jgi:serine protease Do